MGDDLITQVTDLEERVEQIAAVSEDVLVNQVGWLTANQSVLAAMLLHVARNSDHPDMVINQIGFEAQSLLRNRTVFRDNDPESAERFRAAAKVRLEQFLADVGGTL
ncbi:hypothetical protein HMPREF0185_02150 [Brevundimonas diminuta 470-4]|nr:hypothetical protein HMPREF0185_02150 [Brevundimonas diminuta 470-4]